MEIECHKKLALGQVHRLPFYKEKAENLVDCTSSVLETFESLKDLIFLTPIKQLLKNLLAENLLHVIYQTNCTVVEGDTGISLFKYRYNLCTPP